MSHPGVPEASRADALALRRLRRRLTAWYAGTLGLIVLGLGGALFVTIRQQIFQQLDASLRGAVAAVMRAADIRDIERRSAHGAVVDAVAELHIPDRQLYLFDSAGIPLVPAATAPWIRDAARAAASAGATYASRPASDEHILRLYARRFRSSGGVPYIAGAVADQVELEDQYTALITAFAGTALVALVLFTLVGSFLTRASVEPVARTMALMRRFMADAAHELRTPLTVLRTRAEVAMQRRYHPEEYDEALQVIAQEAERLGHIVEDLLLLARSDSGERPIARTALFLDDIALDAASALRPLADRHGITLDVGTFDEAPIVGDATLIRQLVMILLDNAVKFTPAGGKVRMSVTVQEGASAAIVEDTGIGIADEHRPHVFDRFYRGDAARDRSAGAGLGLSIARWIAEVHGAHIDLQSALHRGTRVTVRFPILP